MKFALFIFISLISLRVKADCTGLVLTSVTVRASGTVSAGLLLDGTEMRYCERAFWHNMDVSDTGNSCAAETPGKFQYTGSDMQYCNGTNWISINGPVNLGSCAGTTAGTIRFDNSNAVMRWCDGTNWKSVKNSGYFVLSSGQWLGGAIGSLTDADTKCYNDLTANDWKGKIEAGTLTAARIKAFLCDSTTCNNLLPNKYYHFAVSGDTSSGGYRFYTDASGSGTNQTNSWVNPGRFGTTNVTYYSGRAAGTALLWGTTPSGQNCSNWTSSAAGTVANLMGNTNSTTDAARWSQNGTCNVARNLVCFVDPN